ncbi:MAG: DUF3332 domain-containing protein [Moritella sp.]|uniref:DUF3332 family protein n=1 Tax=unclassified Moritella TaxID=2637987 RepID=UPI0002D5C9ED|nr:MULTISPECIES: DUF3332 family protein [unclassified Moritella]MBL1418212.1 DUF3332 family protein [Moritella sp.]PHR87552.1 MAG: DUF3332 domain-containing protein [Moritella sp.]
MKIKKMICATIIAASVSGLTGCIGQMGLTQLAMGVNLKAVDNRYGRAGIYVVAAPVYGVTALVDLMVINSIEFWTGTNPITKKGPAVADTPVEAWMKINDDLDPVLTGAPLKDLKVSTQSTSMEVLDDDSLKLTVAYVDGSEQSIIGKRLANNDVAFYNQGRLVAVANNQQLLDHVASL